MILSFAILCIQAAGSSDPNAGEMETISAQDILKDIRSGNLEPIDGAIINGSLDLRNLKDPIRGDIKITNSIINGPVNFAGKTFEGQVDFSGTTFKKYVKFVDSYFVKSVNFDRISFDGGSDFKGAQFHRDASFRLTNFSGGANFEDAQFDENINFSGANFLSGNMIFMDSRFEKEVQFDQVNFGGNLKNFDQAVFGGEAIFRKANFIGDVSFNGALFKRDVSFTSAIFNPINISGEADLVNRQEADFKGSQFNGKAEFEGAEFGGDAKFEDVKFDEAANFNGVNFNGSATNFERSIFGEDAYFRNDSFAGDVSFNETLFKGDAFFIYTKFNQTHPTNDSQPDKRPKADFKGAQFKGKAEFENAEFGGDAKFESVKFDEAANFNWVNFNGSVTNFERSIFGQDAHFRNPRFDGTANFDYVKFEKDASFIGASFKQNLSLTGSRFNRLYIRWNDIDNKLTYDDEVYLKLVENYKNIGLFSDADNCYYSHRVQRGSNLSWGHKLFDLTLWAFYGYGVKPFRPIFWSIVVILGFSYWLWAWTDPNCSFKRSLKFSVKAFLSGTKPFSSDLINFSELKNEKKKFKDLALFERFLGTLFFLLFLITLANTVIIK
jgi:hypothetical protein